MKNLKYWLKRIIDLNFIKEKEGKKKRVYKFIMYSIYPSSPSSACPSQAQIHYKISALL